MTRNGPASKTFLDRVLKSGKDKTKAEFVESLANTLNLTLQYRTVFS